MKKGKEILVAFLIIILASFYSFTLFQKSNVSLLVDGEEHFQKLESEDVIYSYFYLDQLKTHGKAVHPVIPSEIIKGPFMRLFIPIFASEKKYQKDLCGQFSRVDSLGSAANQMAKWAFNSDCYSKYLKVSINGQPVDLDYDVHRFSHKRERGALTHIPTDNFLHGKNILSISKMESPEQPHVSFSIPFWFDSED